MIQPPSSWSGYRRWWGWRPMLSLLCCLSLVAPAEALDDSTYLGIPVAPSRGKCVEYTSMAGNGICAEHVSDKVYFIPDSERDWALLEALMLQGLTYASAFGTAECVARVLYSVCAELFPRCSTSIVGDTELAFPNPICRESCERWWSACSGTFNAALNFGQGDDIISCGTEGHGVRQVDRYGVHGGAAEQPFEYPDGLQGEPLFPEAFTTWTSPDDPSVQVQLPCVREGNQTQSTHSNVSAPVDLNCPDGIMMQFDLDTGKGPACQFVCPHPLYSSGEYSLMRTLFVVPAVLGGVLCIFLLLDTLRTAFSRTKEAKAHRKEDLYTVQGVIGMYGTVFFVIGPFPVIITGDMGCNGLPVIIGILDIDNYVPDESAMCVIQRSIIFVIMGLFNTGLVHMLTTYTSLQRASQMRVNKSDPRARARRLRRKLFVAVFIPAGLCAAMYGLDELDQASDSYQGHLARWTFICGPRLTTAQELALVYVPFALSGLAVTLQSVRSWRLMRHLLRVSSAQNQNVSVTHDSTNLRLRTFNNKVTLLGLLCAMSLTIFVIATAILVPSLASSTRNYLDWVVCSWLQETGTFALLSSFSAQGVSTCEELLAIVGNRSADVKDLNVGRPSAELIALTFFAEAFTVCIFGGFYTSFVLKRRREEFKVASRVASSRKKESGTKKSSHPPNTS